MSQARISQFLPVIKRTPFQKKVNNKHVSQKRFTQTVLSRYFQSKKRQTKQISNDNMLRYYGCTIGRLWANSVFSSLMEDSSFHSLLIRVDNSRKEESVFPSGSDIFAFTHYCPPNSVKVIIIGQDPYPTKGMANGLAFACNWKNTVPVSLQKIYQELKSDIDGFLMPNHGRLQPWAYQGVLLLNTILTIVEGKPMSHSRYGWQAVTGHILKWFATNRKNIVFIGWGQAAREHIRRYMPIDTKEHLVLFAAHPTQPEFRGCHHFSQCNEYLVKHGKESIDWSALHYR